jgi:hypothetical protein
MTKKLCLIFLLLFCFGSHILAQRSSYKDSIELVENFFSGVKFYQHDQKLSLARVSQVMYPDKEATKYLNKAKTNNTISIITGFIGGFLVGYEFGSWLGGDEINWAVMGTGAAIIVIGIPFDNWFRRNARKAVYLYNGAYR